MDEQRMLAEIERRLAAEDPGLASDLTSFRKPSRVSVLRSTRARVVGSVFTVIVVAAVSLMVYAMLPFRSSGRTVSNHPVTTASTSTGPGQAKIGAEPGKSTATTSASAQPSGSHGATAGGKSSPSASSAAHGASAPAVAQSGTSASAGKVNSP
jgi:cytoskeletal protein RodZ